jgi:hypothetical protein
MEGSGGYEYRNKDAKIRDQSDFHSERIPSPDAQAVVLDAVEIDLRIKKPRRNCPAGLWKIQVSQQRSTLAATPGAGQ